MNPHPLRERRIAVLFVAVLALLSPFLLTAPLQAWPPDALATPPPDAPQVSRIYVADTRQVNHVAALGLDLLEARGDDYLLALTTSVERERLQALGYRIEPDVQATGAMRRFQQGVTFMDGYSTVEEVMQRMEQAALAHPSLAEMVDYGDSWLRMTQGAEHGADLWALRLTNRSIPGPKPVFMLIAAVHARELTTTELALRWMDEALSQYGQDADITWLLDWHELWIIPVANPDGRKVAETGILHRKNVNDTNGANCGQVGWSHVGVDLNRNAGWAWGASPPGASSGVPCDQTYRGPSAASEPEEQALEALMRAVFPQQRNPDGNDPAPDDAAGVMISLHSYSNLVLWPWGYTYSPAPNYAGLKALGDKMATYNGYRSCQPSLCLYIANGTHDDWAYGTLGIAAYTFEVGPSSGPCGGFMPPYECVDAFWLENAPALRYAAKAARAPYLLSRGPDALDIQTVTVSDTLTITASISDLPTGGNPIAAAEFYVNTPPWAGGNPLALDAADGAWDAAVEAVMGTRALADLPAGRHMLWVRGRDAAGFWGPPSAVFFEVTDNGQQTPTATPSATATVGETATPTVTPSATVTVGETATPTVTPSATPTATDIPIRLYYLPLWMRMQSSTGR